MRRRHGQAKTNKDKREVPDVTLRWGRVIAYLRPYIRRLMVALVALVGSAVLSLVFPAVIGGVGEIPGVLSTVLEQQDTELLNTITAVLLAVFFIRSITSLVETYNLNYIGERIMVDVRKQLYAHLHTQSLHFFTERRVGELVSRISSDVTAMRTALTKNITSLLQQSLILIGSIVIMFVINWRLSMFILIQIPIISAIVMLFGVYVRRISTEVQDAIAGSTVVAEEAMQNIREVKSFTREPYEVQRYSSAIDRAFTAAVKLLRMRSVFGPVAAFLGFGGLSLTVWFGGREVIANRLAVGELVAFLIYGLTVGGSFAVLVNLYSSFQEALGAMKRVFQILDTAPDIHDNRDATELSDIEGRITFDGVSFAYDERQQVLHDIQLDIAPGEIVALVGPSGAGKSTMFNLIPRFYDTDSGSICVDGFDVRNVTQSSLLESNRDCAARNLTVWGDNP
ncbi:MAG: ABC transporter transmembrane domain-containing protein [Anaerolineae bacterium]|nr:ABC transporter transmembrane domain-containing protein [Anaerolineae bacterium]